MANKIKKAFNQVSSNLSFETILRQAVKMPVTKVNREKFLRKNLSKKYKEDVVKLAIDGNPAKAGIPRKEINNIADNVIKYESTKVTALSMGASLGGAFSESIALTADITQYFVYILRVLQKLAYLYGFEDFELNEEDIDEETLNNITLFIGVMFGVEEANVMIVKLGDAVANKIAKNLAAKALTKGAIYPIVKDIAKTIGVHMTKQIFADSVANMVPAVSALASGGLTFAMFKPCCKKLKNCLKGMNISDPNFYNDSVQLVL